MSNYNADREDLFTEAGLVHLSKTAVLEVDRFVLDQLLMELRTFAQQLVAPDKGFETFAQQDPAKEGEARAILDSINGVWVSAGLPVGMQKHRQTSMSIGTRATRRPLGGGRCIDLREDVAKVGDWTVRLVLFIEVEK